MNRTALAVIIALALAGCRTDVRTEPPDPQMPKPSVSDWATLSDGLQCNIALSKTAFRVGESIPVVVRLRNSRAHNVRVPPGYYHTRSGHPAFHSGIDPVVLQPNGAALQETRAARFKLDSVGKILKLGEEDGFSFDLTHCYQLDVPGKYTLYLAFTKKYSGFADGESNRVHFEILQ